MNWQDAFLTQAWSDFQVFREMNRSRRYPPCHALHYLQMASEKLAKGFMCKRSMEPPRRLTHYSLVNFLNVSKSQRDWREKLGYRHNPKAYGYYIDSLLPIARRIERLVPQGTHRINAEYPWLTAEGDVACPCLCNYDHIDLSDVTRFRDLIHALFHVVGFRD